MDFTNTASIKDLSLLDYLQLILTINKDKNIIVRSTNKLGVIVVRNKKIIFAIDYLGNKGENAFYNICSWKEPITFREFEIKEFVGPNINYNGNILLKATEYIDKNLVIDKLDEELSDIEFYCKYDEIQKIFIKNKILYLDIKNENRLVKDVINELIIDYNIETLVILEKENKKNKIVALHNCEVIDFCDLLYDIFEKISQIIYDRKFSFSINQYQVRLENNKIMIVELIENTNYLIGLLVDTEKLSLGFILNVFIPLLKDELLKILIH